MAQAQDPASGINSWLEEELFHQYQFDRGSVDRGWVDLFNQGAESSPSNGNTATALEELPASPQTNGTSATLESGAPAAPPVSQQDPPVEVPPVKEPPGPATPEREP